MSKLQSLYTLYYWMHGKAGEHSDIVWLYYELTKGKKDFRFIFNHGV